MTKLNNGLIIAGIVLVVVAIIFIQKGGTQGVQALISGPNLIDNPGFESGTSGWDFRGVSSVFSVDTTIAYSGSASAKLAPCGSGCSACGGDRSIWDNTRIPVTVGDTIKFTAYVRHPGCSDASLCNWVNPASAGVTYGCCRSKTGLPNQCSIPYSDFEGRGGARFGVDFRDSAGTLIWECMNVYDWTMPANQWGWVEIVTQVPPGAINAVVWMQGYSCNAPASVWIDDVSLAVVTEGTCTPFWSCSTWSVCTGGTQTRTCTDNNNCGVTTGKPATSQSCTSGAFMCDANSDGLISKAEAGNTIMKWVTG